MKTIVIRIILILAAAAAFSIECFAQKSSLEVVVKNIKTTKGTIRVALFTTEDTFLKKSFAHEVKKVSGTEGKVVFENVPAGRYAISVIHDENENTELDTNFIGMPTEGFAFGNDAMGTFGPPSFQDAIVVLNGTNVTHAIKLKYL